MGAKEFWRKQRKRRRGEKDNAEAQSSRRRSKRV
jgi:hypothetical protein